ncbi:MAG: hypothetical protein KJ914_06435 [Gammaproteobacteria bacterium]|nr:hypothetical protein [Gammaproteobacteria bacterium]MBU1724442.1 hypothetical protein [Gammaproteobacteria bacterium]MBU2004164.1 hypothetical protein [Gammaproteobacteria bacterium]
MNKQALSLAVFIAGAYPAASSALGLGDIESSSHLNQPLRATIDLLAAAPADANQIQVRLASPDVFSRVGVARPDFLGDLHFTPTVQSGKPVILVTSDVPMQEPFVNFLLEVSWPQGQLLKEYTVMLDPPVLMQPGNTVAGEAAVRAEPKSAGTVRRPQPQTGQRTDSAPAHQAAQGGGARTYRVKSGDTLFRVASRLQQQGVSNDQMMMALFRANPGAFIGNNINNLKAGAELKAPAGKDAGAISRAEARRAIRQQNAEWREFRKTLAKSTVPQKAVAAAAKPAKPADNTRTAATKTPDQARLEVLGAKEGQAVSSNAAVAAGSAKLDELEKQLALARESLTTRQNENNELKSRVSDLESLLSKKDRLISLRDEQLASLQQQLAGKGIVVPPVAGDAETAGQQMPVQGQPEAVTPPVETVAEQGKDIQTHVANVTGQDNDTVMRGGQEPATSALVTAAPEQPPPANVAETTSETPPVRQTPASMAVGNSRIPLSPPANNAAQVPEKPAVVPVAPVSGADSEDKQPQPVFADQSKDGNDLMSLLTSPLALQIGAGSLALLLLLWLLGRRRKPSDSREAYGIAKQYEDPKVGVAAAGVDDTFDLGSLENELDKAESRQGAAESTYDDDSGDDPFGMAVGDAWNGESTANKLKSDDAADAQEEDDLLTEANVYIAYGLYQQAESELKKGIERHPERLEYRHKLLECYFVANNREAFDRQASQFAALEGTNKATLWKAVSEWGRKISPDNTLYQEGGINKMGVAATVAAALGGVAATALAGSNDKQVALHEDLAAGDNPGFSLDNSLADIDVDMEPDTDVPVAAKQASEEFEDLDLGDLDFGDLDLDKLLQETDQPEHDVMAAVGNQGLPHKKQFDSIDFDDDLPDLPDFEEQDTGEVALPEPVVATVKEPLFDMELDDLDLDLDHDQGKPMMAAMPELTPVADDDLLDFVSDDAEAASSVAVHEPETAMAKAAHAANLNLHLDNSSGLNRILPKDTFYAPAEGADEDWLGDIDDALSFLDFPDEEIDLHEAHISTKLDLARAYLDMGDIEGARSTLEEVMVEGNDDQRREAEVLLHQTG